MPRWGALAFGAVAMLLALVVRPAEATDRATYPSDFPDPFVVRNGSTYYAFATNRGPNVQAIRSKDLVHWTAARDSHPLLPRWAARGHTWAPSVVRRGVTWVLYYTAREASTGLQCISRAVAFTLDAPFLDQTSRPFVCQRDRGGSIDASPFVDADGAPYLLWKSEGRGPEPSRIWVQRLSNDGQSLVGTPRELLHPELPWEGGVVEGPSMVRVDRTYLLFYSANHWDTAAYAVGVAVCRSVAGPCVRPGPRPALAVAEGRAGPGGQEFFTDAAGQLSTAYHAWDPAAVGYPRGARRLHLARVGFSNGWPMFIPR